MTILIKPIGEMHLNAVKTIEKTCFPIPWDDRIFCMLARWKGRILLERGKIVHMSVAEEDKETIGYIVWEENRLSLRGRIMNIAVRELSRRKGFGKLLLSHALRLLANNGIKICELEVRESNLSARCLYESVGMRVSGRTPGYYESEDAIIYSIEF